MRSRPSACRHGGRTLYKGAGASFVCHSTSSLFAFLIHACYLRYCHGEPETLQSDGGTSLPSLGGSPALQGLGRRIDPLRIVRVKKKKKCTRAALYLPLPYQVHTPSPWRLPLRLYIHTFVPADRRYLPQRTLALAALLLPLLLLFFLFSHPLSPVITFSAPPRHRQLRSFRTFYNTTYIHFFVRIVCSRHNNKRNTQSKNKHSHLPDQLVPLLSP
ncbi:hypothetical protein F5Y14DRAFT_335914 [Nemania sp. NC0429]|nr:hypothetical protein F5Y14DRAFT_335914 [Nemania sp. NC0429]